MLSSNSTENCIFDVDIAGEHVAFVALEEGDVLNLKGQTYWVSLQKEVCLNVHLQIM